MKTVVTNITSYAAFLRGSETLEKEYPWLTFGSIMMIEDLLHHKRKKWRVLEMGSGGSTLFFSKRVKEVVSVDTDPKWNKVVKEKLPKDSNVTLVCGAEAELKDYIEKLPDESFDMMLADSGTSYKTRYVLMMASLSKLKKGGWLIIDNYDNGWLRKFDYTGWEYYTFDMGHYSGKGTRVCKKL